ncbi:MAG: 2-oxo acid dehydrogenase subunit E2 [Chloroflexota bacterium]|nr:2-oxo acid dehydrogenase subunit E2 [Chloroflexota bacterium]
MPEEIVMPRLSDTMEEGTISQWLKREGDTIKRGDAILEVQTDKANMELEAYSDGVIQQIIHPDGATVPIGTVVGMLAKAGEAVAPTKPAQAAPASSAQNGATGGVGAVADAIVETESSDEVPVAVPTALMPAASAQAPAPTGGANGATDGGRVKASPLARNIAREHDIDLQALGGHGSGPGGRIVKLDVERYLVARANDTATTTTPQPPAAAATAPPAPAPAITTPMPLMEGDEVQPANRVQQIMARRLLESKTTIPHFYVTTEVDMAAAADLRTHLLETFGPEGKVSYNDLIVRACALTLRAMPDVNSSWRDGQFVRHGHVNVGVAVSLPDGLVVPVIKDADRKGLREIAVEARALAEKARAGKLAPRDMEGGTFSTSNLGAYDVAQFQAIVNPPESAILAIGSILEKPVVLDGQVVARPRMTLSLSVDHRVIPGVPAAQFLQGVKRLLQEPLRLGF